MSAKPILAHSARHGRSRTQTTVDAVATTIGGTADHLPTTTPYLHIDECGVILGNHRLEILVLLFTEDDSESDMAG